MGDADRNRLRLWLRSERALGLTSVAALSPPLALGTIPEATAEAEELENTGNAEHFDPAAPCEPVNAPGAARAIAPPQAPPPVASRASSLFADEQPTGLVMPSP